MKGGADGDKVLLVGGDSVVVAVLHQDVGGGGGLGNVTDGLFKVLEHVE